MNEEKKSYKMNLVMISCKVFIKEYISQRILYNIYRYIYKRLYRIKDIGSTRIILVYRRKCINQMDIHIQVALITQHIQAFFFI